MRDDVEQRFNMAAMLVNSAADMLATAAEHGADLGLARGFANAALQSATAILVTEIRVAQFPGPKAVDNEPVGLRDD